MTINEQNQVAADIAAALNEWAEDFLDAANAVIEPLAAWLTGFSEQMNAALLKAFGPMIERQRQRYEHLGMTSEEYHRWVMSLPDEERHREIHIMCGAQPVDSPANLLRPEGGA